MKSHDFLHLYQLHTAPTTVVKDKTSTEKNVTSETMKVNVTETESGTKNENQESGTKNGNESVTCELARRRATRIQSSSGSGKETKGTGYFDNKWRLQLCRCPSCMVSIATDGTTHHPPPGASIQYYLL